MSDHRTNAGGSQNTKPRASDNSPAGATIANNHLPVMSMDKLRISTTQRTVNPTFSEFPFPTGVFP